MVVWVPQILTKEGRRNSAILNVQSHIMTEKAMIEFYEGCKQSSTKRLVELEKELKELQENG
jgi:hypothetical protein